MPTHIRKCCMILCLICAYGTTILQAQISQIDDKIELKSDLEQALEFALNYEEDYKDQALGFLNAHYNILLENQGGICAPCNAREPKYCELIERVCYVSLDAPLATNSNKIGNGTFLMNKKEKQIYNTLGKKLAEQGEENPLKFIANRGEFLVLGFPKTSTQKGLDFERDVRVGYEFLRKNLQYLDSEHKNVLDEDMMKTLFWGAWIDEHTTCIAQRLPSFDMLLSNGVTKDSILDMPQFGEKCSGGSIMGYVNADTFVIAQIYSQQYYYGGDYYLNSIVFVNDGDTMYVFLRSNPPPA